MSSWRLAHIEGDAAAFHGEDPSPHRSATFVGVERATLVLGSTQAESTVDGDAASRRGIAVVRRRSGGGGVLLLPGEFVWLDLVIPADDPLWSPDVGVASHWVGELWRASLASLGVDGSVHRGPMITSTWSRQVCFAGVGPGEVMAGAVQEAGKLAGVSQRRTRSFARFQTMCHLRWRPEIAADLVAEPKPSIDELAGIAAEVPATAEDITAALVFHLPD